MRRLTLVWLLATSVLVAASAAATESEPLAPRHAPAAVTAAALPRERAAGDGDGLGDRTDGDATPRPLEVTVGELVRLELRALLHPRPSRTP